VEFYFLAVEAHPGALHAHPAVFFPFGFKVCKKCYYDPKKNFLEKYQNGYQKNAEFYADFKFVDAGFQKCS
jgi:hypothetical protein